MINKFLTYIFDKSNFLELYLFWFVCTLIMWVIAAESVSAAIGQPILWNIKTATGDPLSTYNQFMLIVIVPAFYGLILTVPTLVKRSQNKSRNELI